MNRYVSSILTINIITQFTNQRQGPSETHENRTIPKIPKILPQKQKVSTSEKIINTPEKFDQNAITLFRRAGEGLSMIHKTKLASRLACEKKNWRSDSEFVLRSDGEILIDVNERNYRRPVWEMGVTDFQQAD